MRIRIRATLVAIFSFAALASMASAAQANLLSILPGSCGTQKETQPFARWGFLLAGPCALDLGCCHCSTGRRKWRRVL